MVWAQIWASEEQFLYRAEALQTGCKFKKTNYLVRLYRSGCGSNMSAGGTARGASGQFALVQARSVLSIPPHCRFDQSVARFQAGLLKFLGDVMVLVALRPQHRRSVN